MDQESIIEDIERRAFEARVSIRALCRHAGINPTTFSRWKKSERNPEPFAATTRSLGKLYTALGYFEALARRRARRAA